MSERRFDPNGNPIQVSVIMGSEKTDGPWFNLTKFKEYMDELGIGYDVSYCSAERHLSGLCEYLPNEWADGIRHYVGVVGWSPRLPAVIAAGLPMTALVYGVAKFSTKALGSADPAASIAVSTPGCPIICVGLDEAAAGNTALLIGMIEAQKSGTMADKVEALRRRLNGAPKFNVDRTLQTPAPVSDSGG